MMYFLMVNRKMQLKKGKVVRKVLLYAVIVLVIIYTLLQISVLAVMSKVQHAFAHTDWFYIYKPMYLEYPNFHNNPKIRYIIEDDGSDGEVDVEMCYNPRNMLSRLEDRGDPDEWRIRTRSFWVALHNFSDGYILLWCKVTAKEKGTIKIQPQYVEKTAFIRPHILHIHRQGWEWVVTQIDNSH